MPTKRSSLASLAYLQNLHTEKLAGWSWYQHSNSTTPRYRFLFGYDDGTLHLDGTKVATHDPVRVGFSLTINKPKKLKTTWKKFVFDFKVKTLVEKSPQENNLILEVLKHNTSVIHTKIFDGSDDAILQKFSTSKPFNSEWQNHAINLDLKNVRKASKLTFKIYTLQNSFRPAKQLFLRNSYILRTPVSAENFPHLPDDHLRKILPKL